MLAYLSNIAMNNLHNRSVVVTTATNNKEGEPLLLRDVQRKLELSPLLPRRPLVLEPVHAPNNLGVSHLQIVFFSISFLVSLGHLEREVTVPVVGDSGTPSVWDVV